jgi:small subunit ribosomal protein S29
MESCLDYFNDRLWIQRPAAKTPEGRNEIKFLSGFNPLVTYEICSAL